MAVEENESPKNPQNPSKRSPHSVPTETKESILSPRFRSAAAMAGWDEEALLLASLVVEDTPVRESKHKKRPNLQFKSPPTTNSNRKRRSQRKNPSSISAVVLRLDDEDAVEEVSVAKRKETEIPVKEEKQKQSPPEKDLSKCLPCMDRLREELSCAICLEICFEPSTTPCGHSFCKECLKCAAAKCGKRCPKCRQLISNGRSCTVNTVLWNTIQLLFPQEVEARKKVVATSSHSNEAKNQSPERSSTNNRISITRSSIRSSSNTRNATQGSRVTESDRGRRRAAPSQSEDAALALRLQREEFMDVFRETREQPRSSVYSARANLRDMAARAVEIRLRGRST